MCFSNHTHGTDLFDPCERVSHIFPFPFSLLLLQNEKNTKLSQNVSDFLKFVSFLKRCSSCFVCRMSAGGVADLHTQLLSFFWFRMTMNNNDEKFREKSLCVHPAIFIYKKFFITKSFSICATFVKGDNDEILNLLRDAHKVLGLKNRLFQYHLILPAASASCSVSLKISNLYSLDHLGLFFSAGNIFNAFLFAV